MFRLKEQEERVDIVIICYWTQEVESFAGYMNIAGVCFCPSAEVRRCVVDMNAKTLFELRVIELVWTVAMLA
jgi:hypothetical protein